jgi:hypothetical protein
MCFIPHQKRGRGMQDFVQKKGELGVGGKKEGDEQKN